MINRKNRMFPRFYALFSITAATFVVPTMVQAVELGNIKIQSKMNEPFKAQIPLSNISDVKNGISANGASAGEYQSLGMLQSNVPLNYKIKNNGDGTGVIYISSSSIITEPFVDILVNVNDDNQMLQHKVSAILTPTNSAPNNSSQFAEANNALNQSSKINDEFSNQEFVLKPIQSAPPPMTENDSVNLPVITNNTDLPEKIEVQPIEVNTPNKQESYKPAQTQVYEPPKYKASKPVTTKKSKNKATKKKAYTPKKPYQPKLNVETSKYSVVKRDTLWGIANRISREKNLPISQVMQDIRNQNRNAFINGNPNRLRSGVSLIVPEFSGTRLTEAKDNLQNNVKKRQENKASTNKSKKSNKRVYTDSKQTPIKNKSKSKPNLATKKLKKSEMRVVAKQGQGKAQGDSSKGSNNKSKLPPQIISQIKKKRQSTIAKRKRVNKLNTELNSFEQKLQVQNTKLAELEARLKKLKASSNPKN